MDQFIIHGGKKLEGEVEIYGVKNGILPAMAAALLAEKGTTIIKNVPNLRDIRTMLKLLDALGAKTNFDTKNRIITINAQEITTVTAPYEIVKEIRASFLVTGPLLARFKKAEVSLPGGCAIGARPIDFHIKAFEKLGAKVNDDNGYILAETSKLSGANFYFDIPTHTGTENIMMAACLAEGTTNLINVACEPEIIYLAKMLNDMGAKISGAGTPFISIKGVSKLHAVEWQAPPSRIETCFFAVSAGITNSDIIIKNAEPQHIGMTANKMVSAGINIQKIDNTTLRITGNTNLKATNYTTWPYPGFMTDFQPQMMALLTLAKGTSIVKETIFENRFMHVNELTRMGANIHAAYDQAVITGVNKLIGANVMASDLQGGAALILAGLAAEGRTTIDRIYHTDRGYETLEKRLSQLGADIKRFNPIRV